MLFDLTPYLPFNAFIAIVIGAAIVVAVAVDKKGN